MFRKGQNISTGVVRDLNRILGTVVVILNTQLSFFSVISRDCKFTVLEQATATSSLQKYSS
jgi:hypothetical protein